MARLREELEEGEEIEEVEEVEEPASAFVQVPEALWRDGLRIQEERRVGSDNCVRWHGRSLQIPPTPSRCGRPSG